MWVVNQLFRYRTGAPIEIEVRDASKEHTIPIDFGYPDLPSGNLT